MAIGARSVDFTTAVGSIAEGSVAGSGGSDGSAQTAKVAAPAAFLVRVGSANVDSWARGLSVVLSVDSAAEMGLPCAQARTARDVFRRPSLRNEATRKRCR